MTTTVFYRNSSTGISKKHVGLINCARCAQKKNMYCLYHSV